MWPLGAAPTPVPLPTPDIPIDPGAVIVALITAATGIVVALIGNRRRTDPSPPGKDDVDVDQTVKLRVLEQNVADLAREQRHLRRDFDRHVDRCPEKRTRAD